MTTYTALATIPHRENAEAMGTAAEALTPAPTGVGVFEIEDGSGNWEVGLFFVEAPDAAGLALLSAAFGSSDFVVSKLPETDWVSHVRRELSPVHAGRFVVHGAHDADALPEGAIPLLIEASMAFGTGHHGTTLGCLRAIDRLAGMTPVPESIADIGCGTAVLAIAAARVWSARILATDIDPVAIEVAQANLAANDLSDRVETVVAAGLDHPVLAGAAPLDLVFANILKGPLLDLAEPLASIIRPGGTLILSGLLNEQASEVIEVYAQAGFNTLQSEAIVDWTTLELRRISA
ncbi:MAG: 50S ribosomal protein L11 methyltransferase [Pseudomonadota bacterium]